VPEWEGAARSPSWLPPARLRRTEVQPAAPGEVAAQGVAASSPIHAPVQAHISH